ncbi:MAG: hypothetical protein MZW92_43110 [Comamonadaceae bacterium]|nr:hypothetical protein [Comamonadaceae bacterium]
MSRIVALDSSTRRPPHRVRCSTPSDRARRRAQPDAGPRQQPGRARRATSRSSGALAKGSVGAKTGERIALAIAEIQRLRLLPRRPTPTSARNVARLDEAEIAANRNGGSPTIRRPMRRCASPSSVARAARPRLRRRGRRDVADRRLQRRGGRRDRAPRRPQHADQLRQRGRRRPRSTSPQSTSGAPPERRAVKRPRRSRMT